MDVRTLYLLISFMRARFIHVIVAVKKITQEFNGSVGLRVISKSLLLSS